MTLASPVAPLLQSSSLAGRGPGGGGVAALDWTMSMPWVWAQSAVPDPTAVPLLALRRWFTSLTLSSPEAVPSRFALVVWLAGLAGLFVLAALFQGPGRALGQLIDLPGQVRLWSAAVGRLRRAGRLVAV